MSTLLDLRDADPYGLAQPRAPTTRAPRAARAARGTSQRRDQRTRARPARPVHLVPAAHVQRTVHRSASRSPKLRHGSPSPTSSSAGPTAPRPATNGSWSNYSPTTTRRPPLREVRLHQSPARSSSSATNEPGSACAGPASMAPAPQPAPAPQQGRAPPPRASLQPPLFRHATGGANPAGTAVKAEAPPPAVAAAQHLPPTAESAPAALGPATAAAVAHATAARPATVADPRPPAPNIASATAADGARPHNGCPLHRDLVQLCIPCERITAQRTLKAEANQARLSTKEGGARS